jgi:hypothetical protein
MGTTATMRTPIERCEEKSLHTQGMLARFNDVAPLRELGPILSGATTILLDKQAELVVKRKALISLRIDVIMCDRAADQLIRVCLKRTEIEDGKPDGRWVMTLFPNGSTPIIKPVGSVQVEEMRKLEGRYDAVIDHWAGAADDKAKLMASRITYESALLARKQGIDAVGQALVARDVAKEEFLDVYAEVASRIEAAFPRDRKTQDLFFLKDRSREDDEVDPREE